jgi:hypothetical protein
MELRLVIQATHKKSLCNFSIQSAPKKEHKVEVKRKKRLGLDHSSIYQWANTISSKSPS